MADTQKDIHCYAIRRLSPFQGLWYIMQTANGTAVTSNGDIWQVQVLIEINRPGWGSLEQQAKKTKRCIFGTWSKSQGLQRSPLNPIVNLQTASAKAIIIVEHLQQYCEKMPFPLQDNFELWLLDRQTMLPVVLLASTDEEGKISTRNNYEWQAFDAKTQDAEHLKQLLEHAGIDINLSQVRATLRHMIIGRCGSTPAAQWFRRADDGSGTGLGQIHADISLQGRFLPKDAFPSLLLSRKWDDDKDRKLVECYLQWMSPALLSLQALSDHEREYLEQAAFQQPLECHKHATTYPCVINQENLNSVLVQAKIRLANQVT